MFLFIPCHLHIENTRCTRSSGRTIGRRVAIVHQCINDAREDTERFLQEGDSAGRFLREKKRDRKRQNASANMAKGRAKKKGFTCGCSCGCGSRNSDVLCKYHASVTSPLISPSVCKSLCNARIMTIPRMRKSRIFLFFWLQGIAAVFPYTGNRANRRIL